MLPTDLNDFLDHLYTKEKLDLNIQLEYMIFTKTVSSYLKMI